MKRAIIVSSVATALVLGCLGAIFASPYYFYHKIISENYRSKWFFLENHKQELASPKPRLKLEEPKLGSESLWHDFHFKDIVIPLPVGNPLYYVAPILSYDEKSQKTRLGITLYGTGYREMSKIYFVNNMLMGSEIRSQELFKLPLARKIIKSASEDKIWKDVFAKDLSEWNIPFSEMVYNLYILQLRSKILPDGMIDFASLDDNTGVIRLNSKNKDYINELVMTRRRGVVYSYLIVTEKKNQESELLRYKFLRDIGFRPGSQALAGMIYKEFKALPYKRKVGHQGMLYLFSAWSHDIGNREFIKEMIFYLERGEENQKQLKPLYQYASARYGKLFSRKLVDGVELDSELELRRNMELEREEEIKSLSSREVSADQRSLSQEERLRERIKEAKKKKTIKKNRMIID